MVKYRIKRKQIPLSEADKKTEGNKKKQNFVGPIQQLKDYYNSAVEREVEYFGNNSEEDRVALQEQRNKEFTRSIAKGFSFIIILFLLYLILGIL